MRPISQPERHDCPGLIGQPVPSMAAVGDDIIVVLEDPIGEPVLAHELPDVLLRVQLRRLRRQRHEGDIFRQLEFSGGVPSSLVEQNDGMGLGGHQTGYFLKMQRHGLSIAIGHDQSGAEPALRTDGAENISVFEALILGRSRAGSPLRPAPRDLVLLADPRFVLPPQLYGRARRQGCPDLFQPGKFF